MSQKDDYIHKEVPVKRQKVEDTKVDIPSSVVAHFTTQEGARTGPPVEIPITSNTKQLETLINALLENSDPVCHSSSLASTSAHSYLLCVTASLWVLHQRY